MGEIVENPCLYRYENKRIAASMGEWPGHDNDYVVRVALIEYKIVKTTPKGAWISRLEGMPPRLVLMGSKRPFACSTIAEAKESFITRKQSQIAILRSQLGDAKEALTLMLGGP